MRTRQIKRARRVAIMKKLNTFFLIYLVFFTTYFSMITLSKYTGKVTGNGAIAAAKWEVSLDTTGANSTLNLVSGNTTQNYILKVTSTSEVAANYSVILSDLPAEIEVAIDGGTYKKPTNNKITFNNVGSFNANDSNTEHSHTLTFNAPLDSDIPSVNSVKLDVKIVQKTI